MALNPLTQADCDVLTAVLGKLNDIGELLGRCKSCQLDTAQLEAWQREQKETAERLKREFFPHCP